MQRCQQQTHLERATARAIVGPACILGLGCRTRPIDACSHCPEERGAK